MWALDFEVDTLPNGRQFRLLNIVDEYTLEALDIAIDYGIDATVATLDRLVTNRGWPEFIRCDNGPELTANAIRDWCRFGRSGVHNIDPGLPWQNPFVESFNGWLRDECLAVEQFNALLEAKITIEDWGIDYNTNRSHSALDMLAPSVVAARTHIDPGPETGLRSPRRARRHARERGHTPP